MGKTMGEWIDGALHTIYSSSVTTIAEIKAAIERLPPEEQEEIKQYLCELTVTDRGETLESIRPPSTPSGAS
jgi:hypothetical protein